MRVSSTAASATPCGTSKSKTGGCEGEAKSELGTTVPGGALDLLSKEASGHQAPAAVQFAAIWSVERQLEQQCTNLQFGKEQPARVL